MIIQKWAYHVTKMVSYNYIISIIVVSIWRNSLL